MGDGRNMSSCSRWSGLTKRMKGHTRDLDSLSRGSCTGGHGDQGLTMMKAHSSISQRRFDRHDLDVPTYSRLSETTGWRLQFAIAEWSSAGIKETPRCTRLPFFNNRGISRLRASVRRRFNVNSSCASALQRPRSCRQEFSPLLCNTPSPPRQLPVKARIAPRSKPDWLDSASVVARKRVSPTPKKRGSNNVVAPLANSTQHPYPPCNTPLLLCAFVQTESQHHTTCWGVFPYRLQRYRVHRGTVVDPDSPRYTRDHGLVTPADELGRLEVVVQEQHIGVVILGTSIPVT